MGVSAVVDEVGSRWQEDARRYLEMGAAFVDGRMSGEVFEQRFLAIYMIDESPVPDPVFNILDGVFADVDDYTTDPELRARVGGLDDEELRERVRAAMHRLTASLEAG